MKRVQIVFELSHAWEEWSVDVPDDADLKKLDFEDVEFVCMEESGNTSMQIAQVFDEEGNEVGG